MAASVGGLALGREELETRSGEVQCCAKDFEFSPKGPGKPLLEFKEGTWLGQICILEKSLEQYCAPARPTNEAEAVICAGKEDVSIKMVAGKMPHRVRIKGH